MRRLRARIRTILLGITAAMIGLYLLGFRIYTKNPLFVPRSQVSACVFDKTAFGHLYDEDVLEAKEASVVVIEPLKGKRRWWAFAQLLCIILNLVGIVIVLLDRKFSQKDFTEEIAEFCFWVSILFLATLRFYPSAYRPPIFLAIAASCIPAALVLAHRDILPRLLLHPSKLQLRDARDEYSAYARLFLIFMTEICALLSPRVWLPTDPYADGVTPSPEQKASTLSYIGTYSWIGMLVTIAGKREIEPSDIPVLPDYDAAKLWSRKLKKARKNRRSSLRALFSFMWVDILVMFSCGASLGVLQFIWPTSMNQLLRYVELGREGFEINPWVWAVALLGGSICGGAMWEAYCYHAQRFVIRVKAAFTQVLLEKTFKTRFTQEVGRDQETKESPQVGMLNNLVSSDLNTLTDAQEFFLVLGTVPVELAIATWLLYGLLGWASLVGIAFLTVTLFIPILITRRQAGVQAKLRQAVDARMEVTSEALNSIRNIKYSALESVFEAKIMEKRSEELRLTFIANAYDIAVQCVSVALPFLNIFVSFTLYTKVMRQPLTASTAFTSLTLFHIVKNQIQWTGSVSRRVLAAFVAFKRLDKFLDDADEVLEEHTASETVLPRFENAILSWSSKRAEFTLNIDATVLPDGLTLVTGPTGSGKTSFLLGLLGEMRKVTGEVRLPRKEGVAFAAQMPWLQNATIRDNILFGNSLDEDRYAAVVDACCLMPDLANFKNGDHTEIGERGLTLSGGQKARVALARAVYSRAPIVLLDDVLAALDSGTKRRIIECCIGGGVLEGRTVVLATHSAHLVAKLLKKPVKLIELDQGEVAKSVMNANLEEIRDFDEDENEKVADETAEAKPNTRAEFSKDTADEHQQLVLEEARARGRVPPSLIWSYIKNFGGPTIAVLVMLLSCVDQLGPLTNSIFVALWTEAYNAAKAPHDVNVDKWLMLYAAVLTTTTFSSCFLTFTWYLSQWLAARRVHEKLVRTILRQPIRFFDTTPTARIVNRFSSGMYSIDTNLGLALRRFVYQAVETAFRLLVMCAIIPAFWIPTVCCGVAGFLIGNAYVRAQLGVKRIVAVRESPILSHFRDAVAGISTIRAFGAQGRLLDENLERIDAYSQPAEALYALGRWVGVRVHWCTGLMAFSAAAIAITLKDSYSPGLMGFSIANAMSFASSILYTVIYFTAFEVEINSFERVDEFTALPVEKDTEGDGTTIPAYWPLEPKLEIRNLSVSYAPGLPNVLTDISFDVNPRERIGIVGRTGAGKSSLVLSMLRFTNITGGTISIDGVDICNVPLSRLRRDAVTMIPQDPVMLSGTVRSNLDPFGAVGDAELRSALLDCGLSPALDLDSVVVGGGENLSQGQRQLLSIGTALIRRSKIIILDEATSSIGYEMDEKIQTTLKAAFPDASLIVVAHRLRTVMGMDRVIVLENSGNGGEIVEVGTPAELLIKEGGMLKGLAERSGEWEELIRMAKK